MPEDKAALSLISAHLDAFYELLDPKKLFVQVLAVDYGGSIYNDQAGKIKRKYCDAMAIPKGTPVEIVGATKPSDKLVPVRFYHLAQFSEFPECYSKGGWVEQSKLKIKVDPPLAHYRVESMEAINLRLV